MRRGQEMVGMPVVALDRGSQVERVKEVIFDRQRNRVVGLLVQKRGWFHNARVLPLRDVRSIGVNAVTVNSANAIVQSDRAPDIERVLEHEKSLNGLKLMTTKGQEIGTIKDVRFDEHTGDVTGFDVSMGTTTDISSSRSYLPAFEEDEVKIGDDVAIVSDAVVQRLTTPIEPQNPKYDYPNENEFPTLSHMTIGDRVREALDTAETLLREEAQQVKLTAGELWETAKDKVGEIQERAVQIIEDHRIKKVLGRPVDRTILDIGDKVILTEGDIITHEAIHQAREAGVLDLLLNSASGGTGESISEPSGQKCEDCSSFGAE